MKKLISRTLCALLAAAMLVTTNISAFAAIGADVAGNQHGANVHYPNGGKLSGAANDKAEVELLRPYFESMGMNEENISSAHCAGVINLKIGESTTLHFLQGDYGYSGKFRPVHMKEYESLIDASGSDKIVEQASNSNSNCSALTFTGKANGTAVFVYRASANLTSFAYYKIVVGSGGSLPTGGKSSASEQQKDEPKKDEPKKEAPPQAAPTTPPSTIGVTHTVKMGDTFAKLALNYYGDMNYWPELYAANAAEIEATANKQIYEGMVLTIPGTIGNGVISPAAAGEGETLYTVKAGDTYGIIALEHFGKMSRYQEVFDRNSDRLKDIDTLFEGQILVLPRK